MQAEADWGSRPITVETFTDCVNLCTFDEACEFLQFNYAAEEGNCRLKVAPTMATTRWVSDHMCLAFSLKRPQLYHYRWDCPNHKPNHVLSSSWLTANNCRFGVIGNLRRRACLAPGQPVHVSICDLSNRLAGISHLHSFRCNKYDCLQ